MKLRNKKTGEIGELKQWWNRKNRNINGVGVYVSPDKSLNKYNSLAELNEEWEDMPEESVKPYWFINDLDGEPMKCDLKNCGKSNFIEWGRHRKEICNYFETEEEAEKAVEKLKAWKLLKDECAIKFDGIIRDDNAMLKGVKLSYDRHTVTFDRMRECIDALHLLFGGEE